MRNASSAMQVTSGVLMLAAVSASSLLAQQLILPPAPAGVEITTQHGIEFATVNLQNNPAYTPDGFTGPPGVTQPWGRGSVVQPFRIARVELTARQYVPFAQAFVRAARGPILSNHDGIFGYFPPGLDGPSPYAGFDNHPIALVPEQAMRLCNWLHNGAPAAPTTMDAFDTGAYDLRGLPRAANGALLELRPERLPGARFFLPDYDQWLAATFYDPNRFGDNQGGYWAYPNRSTQVPVATDGDLTQGTFYFNGDDFNGVPVASFPDQQSAWGLLDTVGGNFEYVDGLNGALFQPSYLSIAGFDSYAGTTNSNPVFSALSFSNLRRAGIDEDGWSGLRIAAVIPSPSAASVVVLMVWNTRRSKR